jgi:hypothetical protein
MINFDYKIFELKNYLSTEEFDTLTSLVNGFDVNLEDVNSSHSFLCWSDNVVDKLKVIDIDRYEKILSKRLINYDDFLFLEKMNKDYNFGVHDYFNFFLSDTRNHYEKVGIYFYFNKCYIKIIEEIYNKKINEKQKDFLLANINIYPKGSFIKKHTDQDPNKERLHTALFFINNDRTIEQGSVLKIYTNDGIVDFVSDYSKCLILEHPNYNYVHEVTENLVDDIRYSIYNPFTIKDYNKKLIHN